MVKTPQKDIPTGEASSIITPSISSRFTRLTPVIPRKKVKAKLKKEIKKERSKERSRKEERGEGRR